MLPILNNGFWMATDQRIGPWSVITAEPVTAEQETNANIIRSFFLNEGWTINAICGMLGCMQAESNINPAFIQETHRDKLPQSASSLTYASNTIVKNFYKEYYQTMDKAYGIGLVQWDGYSDVQTPSGVEGQQKLVAYAIRNNIIWYDGWTQLYRLRGEQQWDVSHGTNTFFHRVRYSGIWYDFNNYPYSTASPETLAAAWTSGYEINEGGVGFRDDNARYWYDWFTGASAPAIIPPEDFLIPLEWDPDEPSFDPDDPADPDPPGYEYVPAWFVSIIQKRKVLKKCRR